MRKKKRHTRYNGGIIRQTKEGTYQAEVNDLERRHRKTFKDIRKACNWIDKIRFQIINQAKPLDIWELRDARKALSILPDNVSLVVAAESWIRVNRGG